MQTLRSNGIDLAYDTFGSSGPLIVLVMGISSQRVRWPDGFCRALAEHGFRVVRFDNRDVGESTWLNHLPAPDPRSTLLRGLTKQRVRAPYTMDDLADDTAGLIEALGAHRAHVVGISMGGMIAQATAIRHPDRLASLTSIMSSPGTLRHSLGTPRGIGALFSPRPHSRAEAQDRVVQIFDIIGSPDYARDEQVLRASEGIAWDRGFNPQAFPRQLAAIVASGSRTAGLRRLTIPTLVIHGSADPLIPVRGGRATARLVPGSRLRVVKGMGHDLPIELWPRLTRWIAEHAHLAS